MMKDQLSRFSIGIFALLATVLLLAWTSQSSSDNDAVPLQANELQQQEGSWLKPRAGEELMSTRRQGETHVTPGHGQYLPIRVVDERYAVSVLRQLEGDPGVEDARGALAAYNLQPLLQATIFYSRQEGQPEGSICPDENGLWWIDDAVMHQKDIARDTVSGQFLDIRIEAPGYLSTSLAVGVEKYSSDGPGFQALSISPVGTRLAFRHQRSHKDTQAEAALYRLWGEDTFPFEALTFFTQELQASPAYFELAVPDYMIPADLYPGERIEVRTHSSGGFRPVQHNAQGELDLMLQVRERLGDKNSAVRDQLHFAVDLPRERLTDLDLAFTGNPADWITLEVQVKRHGQVVRGADLGVDFIHRISCKGGDQRGETLSFLRAVMLQTDEAGSIRAIMTRPRIITAGNDDSSDDFEQDRIPDISVCVEMLEGERMISLQSLRLSRRGKFLEDRELHWRSRPVGNFSVVHTDHSHHVSVYLDI